MITGGLEFIRKNSAYLKCGGFIAVLAAAVGLDLVPCAYWNEEIEHFFSYDPGNVLSVLAIVWGFTTALLLFYMERDTVCMYGICPADILACTGGAQKLKSLHVLCFAELLFLVVASMYGLMITITLSAFIQLVTMCYVYFFVRSLTSSEKLIQRIKKQMQKECEKCEGKMNLSQCQYEKLLLVRMIRNIDYQNYDEVDRLSRLLESLIFQHNPDIHDAEPAMIRRVCQRITEYILVSGGYAENVQTMLKNLAVKGSLEAQKGVVAALIQQTGDAHGEAASLRWALVRLDGCYYKELQIWSRAYYEYLKNMDGQAWRRIFAKEIEEKTEILWDLDATVRKDRQYTEEIADDYMCINL